MKKSSVLITGGAGFIGSAVAKELENEFDLFVIDNLFTGNKERLEGVKHEFIEKDVLDIRHEDLNGIDYVIHLAAFISAPDSIDKISLSHQINVNGTLALLEAARYSQIKKLIFISSAAVYGNSDDLPYTESGNVQLLSPYALQKYIGEKYCEQYFTHHKVPCTVLRPFNAYGIGQDPKSPYCGVITKFLEKYKKGEPFTIFGDGNHYRDFVHVSDISHAIACVLQSPFTQFDIFNICSGQKTSINELVQYIGGEGYSVEHKPSIVGDPVGSLGCPNKMKEAIGFQVRKDIQNELIKMKGALQ